MSGGGGFFVAVQTQYHGYIVIYVAGEMGGGMTGSIQTVGGGVVV